MVNDRSVKVLLFNMCMIIDEINNRVLVQDKVEVIGDDWCGLTFPGGHVENAESVIDSTIREVKEETGLDIQDLKPCGLIDWYNTDNHERWFVFLFKTNNFTGKLLKETEEGKIFWMDIDEFKNSKLAPNMDTYLKLFFDDNINEVFATWNETSSSNFKLI